MFRFSGWHIVGVVLLSMATAVGYYKFTVPNPDTRKLASEESVVSSWKMNFGKSDYGFETAETCDSQRLFLQKELEKMPPHFRGKRSILPAEFTRECVTFSMRKSFAEAQAENGTKFLNCQSDSSTGQVTSFAPCVTEEYVNVTYNTFGDVFSCLNVPQKESLVELAYQTGLHVGVSSENSAWNNTELEFANEDFNKMKDFVSESAEPSCRRLQPFIAKLKPVDMAGGSAAKHSCELSMLPQNPLLSLFYRAITRLQTEREMENYMAKKSYVLNGRYVSFHEITQEVLKIKQTSEREMASTKFDNESSVMTEKIRTLAIVQSNDLGVRGSLDMLAVFLNEKIAAHQALKEGDFDFHLKPDAMKLRMSVGEMSYPQFMFSHYPMKVAGSRYYLFKLAEQADQFNQLFKEDSCVPESFLK